MDYSLLGSSVHGIFQARVLEWGAIAFSMVQTVVKDLPVISNIIVKHGFFYSILLILQDKGKGKNTCIQAKKLNQSLITGKKSDWHQTFYSRLYSNGKHM